MADGGEGVRLTVLCDDLVLSRRLLGEHGLALLVQTPSRRVLWDTGSGLTLLHNARELGVDLAELDAVCLSHGHYDHTGGLGAALAMTGSVPVYGHPAIFGAKYRMREGRDPVHIGIPWKRQELEQKGARMVLRREMTRLGPDLWLTGEIPREHEEEGCDSPFRVLHKGQFRPDPLEDDQALVVRTRRGLLVILGCAHAGLGNTLRQVRRQAGSTPILAVVGGMHLLHTRPDGVRRAVALLEEAGVQEVYPGHCTGLRAEAALLDAFGSDRFRQLHVGAVLEFD